MFVSVVHTLWVYPVSKRFNNVLSLGASHFLVKFDVDNCVCVIPRKHIIDPGNLSVGGHCEVNWSSSEALSATIIAMGEKQAMEEIEKEFLRNMFEEEDVDTEPPAKKAKKTKSSTNSGK